MACGLSFVHVARLVNAALMDYGIITAEDTSQSKINANYGTCYKFRIFSVVTPAKLYRESIKMGMKLNSEAKSGFSKNPPAFASFDGKIMDVQSHKVDTRGVKHPEKNRKDQIGE